MELLRKAGIATFTASALALALGLIPSAAGATATQARRPVVGIRVSLPGEGSEVFVAGLADQQRPYAGNLGHVSVEGTANGGRGDGLTCRLSFSITTPQVFARQILGPCPNGRWDQLRVSVPSADSHSVASLAMVVSGRGGTTVDAGELYPAPTAGDLAATSPIGQMIVGVVGPTAVAPTTYRGGVAYHVVGPIETVIAQARPSGPIVASTCTVTVAGIAAHSWPCVPGQGFDPASYFSVPSSHESRPVRITFRVAGVTGTKELSLWLLP